jgi:hypothetical protein
VADDATWERAKQAAEKSGQGDNYALITYIYQNMGGTILSGNQQVPNNKEGDMPLSDAERKVLVDNLLDCCWEKEDQEALEGLTDNQLTKLSDQAKQTEELTLVANAAKEVFKLSDDLKANEMPEALKKAMAAKDGEEDEDEEDKEKEKKVAEKTENALTEEQVLNAMSPEMREDLAFARNEKAKQRQTAIDAVTANLQGDQKAKIVEHLGHLTLEQIRDFAALTPEPKRTTDNYGTVPPVENQGEKEVPLGSPTWDFST